MRVPVACSAAYLENTTGSSSSVTDTWIHGYFRSNAPVTCRIWVSSALLKITRPLSFFDPATSAARLSEAVDLAPAELVPCAPEPAEPELPHAAAAPITNAATAAVAARRGQRSLDIFFLPWKIADLL